MAIGLGLLAILLLVGLDAFGGAGGEGVTSNTPSIVSHSSVENQIKLCAEGRDSTYGDPPSPAQQGKCLNQLADQISGSNSSSSGTP